MVYFMAYNKMMETAYMKELQTAMVLTQTNVSIRAE